MSRHFSIRCKMRSAAGHGAPPRTSPANAPRFRRREPCPAPNGTGRHPERGRQTPTLPRQQSLAPSNGTCPALPTITNPGTAPDGAGKQPALPRRESLAPLNGTVPALPTKTNPCAACTGRLSVWTIPPLKPIIRRITAFSTRMPMAGIFRRIRPFTTPNAYILVNIRPQLRENLRINLYLCARITTTPI